MQQLQIKRSITDRSDTALNSYLKDINKIPMLSREEELEIAKKAAKGDMKVDICSNCHPYWSGNAKSTTRGGRADKFKEKYGM